MFETARVSGELRREDGSARPGVALRFVPTSPGVYPGKNSSTVVTGVTSLSGTDGTFEAVLPRGVEYNLVVTGVPGVFTFRVPDRAEVDIRDILFPVPESVQWEVSSPGYASVRVKDQVGLSSWGDSITLRLMAEMSNGHYESLDLSTLDWSFLPTDPTSLVVDHTSLTLSPSDIPDGTILHLQQAVFPGDNLGELFPRNLFPERDAPITGGWGVVPRKAVVSYPALTFHQVVQFPEPPPSCRAPLGGTGIRSFSSVQDRTLTAQEGSATLLRLDAPLGGQVHFPEAEDLIFSAPAAEESRVSMIMNIGSDCELRSSATVHLMSDDGTGYSGVERFPLISGEEYWVTWVYAPDLAIAGHPGREGWLVVPVPLGKRRLTDLETSVAPEGGRLRFAQEPLVSPVLSGESGLHYVVDDDSGVTYVQAPSTGHTPEVGPGWNVTVLNQGSTPLGLKVPAGETLFNPSGFLPSILPKGKATFVCLDPPTWAVYGDLVPEEPATTYGHVLSEDTVIREPGTYVIPSGVTEVEIASFSVSSQVIGGYSTAILVNTSGHGVSITAPNLIVPKGLLPEVIAGGTASIRFFSGIGSYYLSGDLDLSG